MFLKAAFKNSHPFIQLLSLILLIFIGNTITSFLGILALLFQTGISIENLYSFVLNITDYPDYLREFQFFSSLGIFVFPAITAAYLFSDNYKEYLKLDTPVSISTVQWTILSMVVVLPILSCIACLNEQMVLPESLGWLEKWMKTQEEELAKATEAMLYAKNFQTLLLNVLIFAVFAGIGEEFIFRGVLQTVLGKFINNKHLVIWLVAVIFSAVHVQFYGFVPRMLLGAYFGYLLYYTRNMWIPVLAHFTNNFISVMLFRIYQDDPQGLEEIDALGYGSTWWMSVASASLFAFVFLQIKKSVEKQG